VDDIDEVADRITAIFELAKPARTLKDKLARQVLMTGPHKLLQGR